MRGDAPHLETVNVEATGDKQRLTVCETAAERCLLKLEFFMGHFPLPGYDDILCKDLPLLLSDTLITKGVVDEGL